MLPVELGVLTRILEICIGDERLERGAVGSVIEIADDCDILDSFFEKAFVDGRDTGGLSGPLLLAQGSPGVEYPLDLKWFTITTSNSPPGVRR